jgi:sterol desaturase/sphingolipid hydroxylase (fatty acid hydroxylase superfamily)
MLHQLLAVFSASTLIYACFSLAEVALGRYKVYNLYLNDWIVDVVSYLIAKVLMPPLVIFLAALLTIRVFPGDAGILAATPVWAQFLAFLVFEDLVQYWYHRALHTFPALWPLHFAHHGAPYMGMRMSERHSFLYRLLLPNYYTAAVLVYLGFGETFVWYSALKGLVVAGAHSEVRWDTFLYRHRPLKPIAWIIQRTISTPATHFAHHALHEGDGVGRYSGNFGNLLFFWDVLFGTALISQQYPTAFGVAEDPLLGPESWDAQLFYPIFQPRTATRGLPAPAWSAAAVRPRTFNDPHGLGLTDSAPL